MSAEGELRYTLKLLEGVKAALKVYESRMRGGTMKAEHKRLTYEDKFARQYYCNANRFVGKIKKANNKKVRRVLDKWDIREV